MSLTLLLLACGGTPPADDTAPTVAGPTTIKERCFPDIGDPKKGFPSYDALGAIVPDHCAGTDHQDIDGIERVVFLGDSVTAGTPPTPEDEYYRATLTRWLRERWGEDLVVDDCSEWGARTDDLLLHEDRGIPACFPELPDPRRTLIVMTVGGNDMLEAAETVSSEGTEAARQVIDEAVALLDEAFAWLREGSDPLGADPAVSDRFPGGVFVVFANVYEFTDATGDLDSCPLASTLGYGGQAPELRQGYIYISEAYMELAVRHGLDMILLLESFCGHGFHAGEPDNECYRGPDAEVWFDATCIHPNPTGHWELAELFLTTILE